ncbi:major facilitator superfamily domain-containing protein [Sporodiniella umbellata]|nr:major facilitator superfamily domain-containing protein [Sporodiniella umbellata]
MVELPKSDNSFYDTIPDGGYGWFIVVCCFFNNFVVFGILSIWGVFSNYYSHGVLEGKASRLELMGVGSLGVAMLNICTPVGPLLSRWGINKVMALGSFLIALGAVMAGFSTEIWHLYVTMGLVYGFGSSLVYMSSVAVISQWFSTHRGTAMGISSGGTGIGGLVMSPFVNYVASRYGLPWAYRSVGLLSFCICAISSVLFRSRLPPDHRQQPVRSSIRLSMLKDADFVITMTGLVIGSTGYLIPLFNLPAFAHANGIDSTQSSTLVGVACAMNALGRIVLGYFSDHIGRMNMFVISSTISGLLCMLLWPFAKTFGSLMAFSIVFGFFCGVYYALAAPIIATVVGTEDVFSGLSLLFIFSSIMAIGPPVASAIQASTANDSFLGVQMFSGALYIFGSLVLLAFKVKKTGSVLSNM